VVLAEGRVRETESETLHPEWTRKVCWGLQALNLLPVVRSPVKKSGSAVPCTTINVIIIIIHRSAGRCASACRLLTLLSFVQMPVKQTFSSSDIIILIIILIMNAGRVGKCPLVCKI
jgi:hypothetical protein